MRITKKVWDPASNSFSKVAVEKEIPIKCVHMTRVVCVCVCWWKGA